MEASYTSLSVCEEWQCVFELADLAIALRLYYIYNESYIGKHVTINRIDDVWVVSWINILLMFRTNKLVVKIGTVIMEKSKM